MMTETLTLAEKCTCVLRLLTQHNLHVYGELVREARLAIVEGRWDSFASAWALAGIGPPA